MLARVRQPHRGVVLTLSAAVLSVLVCACGGNSSTGPSSQSTVSATPSTSDSVAVRQAWTTFFDGRTSASQKIALLQDGPALASTIRAQAGSSLATSAGATVNSVTIASPDRATVHYDITLGGQTALSNQTGIATKVDGHWLVSLRSFCGLLSLEGQHPAACPAAQPTTSR